MGFVLVQKYARYSVKRPWFHRINVLMVFIIFLLSGYGLLAYEALSFWLGILMTFAATALFASASAFKKRHLSHES